MVGKWSGKSNDNVVVAQRSKKFCLGPFALSIVKSHLGIVSYRFGEDKYCGLALWVYNTFELSGFQFSRAWISRGMGNKIVMFQKFGSGRFKMCLHESLPRD